MGFKRKIQLVFASLVLCGSIYGREYNAAPSFPASLSVAQKQNPKLTISPNPAQTATEIKATTAIKEVHVYGILGNEVSKQKTSGETYRLQLNLTGLKKGKYLVRVIFQDGSTEVKALLKN